MFEEYIANFYITVYAGCIMTAILGLVFFWSFYNSGKFANVDEAKANDNYIFSLLFFLFAVVSYHITYGNYQEIQQLLELDQSLISTECSVKEHRYTEYLLHFLLESVVLYDGYLLLEYNVNETVHQESALAFNGEKYNRTTLKEKLNLIYPVNSTVICFYSKNDSKKVFIENLIKHQESATKKEL